MWSKEVNPKRESEREEEAISLKGGDFIRRPSSGC